MTQQRLHVPVPTSDARRDRVEQAVFGQLSAMRAAERFAEITAPRPARWYFAIPLATTAALAIVVIVMLQRDRGAATAGAPSRIITPVGGSSRFTVGDAMILVGADTSVKIEKAGEAVTLVLERGMVDCDVTPRAGRAPFRVTGGEVQVEVVGTRFVVTRAGPGARVEVIRGKVAVRAPGGERRLSAGESWTPTTTTATTAVAPPPAVEPAPAPAVESTPAPAVEPAPAPAVEPAPAPAVEPQPAPAVEPEPAVTLAPRTEHPRPSRRAAFAVAQRLEAKDLAQAAAAYRALARGHDAWAALALYSLAELRATAQPDRALADLNELAKRFPRGANAEDAAWLRIGVLRRLGRSADARTAAAAYLRAYPEGTYVTAAAQIAGSR